MKKLKIGYFADGPWSHKAFEKIIIDSELEIAFLVPRLDTKDQMLRIYAEKYNIDYLHPVNVNSDDFYNKAKTYNCDLFVSMSFNQIFRNRIINLPILKTINCHAGKLPFYRGRNILNWALINDEKEFGITVHYVDEGVDTGDIILQRSYPIAEDDNYGSLLETAFTECASILYKAIKQIQEGINERIPQDSIHPVGSYCGKRGQGDEIINWNQDSRTIFNFIRSISRPGPRATTRISESLVKINRAQMVENAPTYKNTPGQLLLKTEKGFLVKTLDSFIEIFEIESDVKLKVGDKLGI
jgi:methionyl-tRNA formyltransferase